jgi:hypothetical protein
MVMKKSAVYSFGGKKFRYDYENCWVEWVSKATKDRYADNEEWMAELGCPMWDIDEKGYIVHDCVGLSPENWKDKGMRDYYLSEWIAEMNEAFRWEMQMEFGVAF